MFIVSFNAGWGIKFSVCFGFWLVCFTLCLCEHNAQSFYSIYSIYEIY